MYASLLSLRNFIVLPFMCRSTVHLEFLCIVWDRDKEFLPCVYAWDLEPLSLKLNLPPSPTVLHNHLEMYMCRFVYWFCILFYWSVYSCVNVILLLYILFLMSFKIWYCLSLKTFFLPQNALAILGPWNCHINFTISFSFHTWKKNLMQFWLRFHWMYESIWREISLQHTSLLKYSFSYLNLI